MLLGRYLLLWLLNVIPVCGIKHNHARVIMGVKIRIDSCFWIESFTETQFYGFSGKTFTSQSETVNLQYFVPPMRMSDEEWNRRIEEWYQCGIDGIHVQTAFKSPIRVGCINGKTSWIKVHSGITLDGVPVDLKGGKEEFEQIKLWKHRTVWTRVIYTLVLSVVIGEVSRFHSIPVYQCDD